MRRSGLLFCCYALLLAPLSPAFADPGPALADGPLPRIVLSGLESYKKDGPEEAMKAWLKDSVLENDPNALSQAGALRQAQARYGAYRGFHEISMRSVSASTAIVCLTLDYDKGPLYAKFVVYRTQPGAVLTNLVFDVDENAVVPACL